MLASMNLPTITAPLVGALIYDQIGFAGTLTVMGVFYGVVGIILSIFYAGCSAAERHKV